MNIKDRLEEGHSKTLTMAIVKYVADDAKRFKGLMDLVFGKDPLLCQRAVWPMSYIAIDHPPLIKPYIGKLINHLEHQENHPAIARNILRIFQEIEMPEKYWGKLVDICFRFIMNPAEPIATRAFSITVAAKICKHYPELKNELFIILEDIRHKPHAPAISVRIKYAIKELG